MHPVPKSLPLQPPITAEELEAAGAAYEDYELWDGRLQVMESANPYSSMANAALVAAVLEHVKARGLGWVTESSAGFIVKRGPDRVLSPDVAFVPREAMSLPPRKGFAECVPALVAEVRSPSQTWEKTIARGGIWLGHEVAVVWLIDPQKRRAVELRLDDTVVLLGEADSLNGAPALPDLRIPLASLFPPPEFYGPPSS
jgi:Uma2 family endonuclease